MTDIILTSDPSNYRSIDSGFFPHSPGAPAILTLPYTRNTVISINTTFTCDANVANRYLSITFEALSLNVYLFIDDIPMVAGESRNIVFSPLALYRHPVIATATIHIPFPPDLQLTSADRILIDALNLQAGDDFTPTHFQIHATQTP